MNLGIVRRKLSASSAVVGLATAMLSAPGAAQTAAPVIDQTEVESPIETVAEDAPSEQLVVTGTRIGRPNLESTVPITSITGADLAQTGRTSIGDVLNDLPQLNSTFSQANSTRFLGTGGLNLLDLYGLGTVRTLVLVNGRRHVGADILNNAISPDINTFPNDLIERVDVVTGGNSAIYGSDAIAGVVNFVLKRDFEGLQLRGQGGISAREDAGAYSASLLAGQNFAEGRGNVAINLEYARQNSLYASGRDYLRQANGFIVTDSDPAGTPNGSDGIPDRLFLYDIRQATFSNNGTILFNGRTGANAGRCGRDAAGAAFDCAFIFRPDGTLVPQTGTRVGVSPNGAILGGNGDTNREGELVQILPQLDRYSANLIAHYEFSDAFVPFIEAKYSRTNSRGQGGSGPAFFTGSTLDGFYERPRLDNPFLSAQARDVITQQLILAGNAPETITDATRVILRRNLLDLGVRTEEAERNTYRVVAGIRGTFNEDWNYEFSGNYGQFDERTKVLGNLNIQRALLGLDAIRNSSGQIVCGSQVDPDRAYSDFGGDPAVLAADIAACQPINPFGLGNISAAARDYVLTDTVSVGKITQTVISGSVGGDTSGFLNLPGGAVGFALGAEYRRDTADFRADPLVSSGYTFYNALTVFDPPAATVKEAFAELRVPLLKDLPLMRELTFTGAGRVADYSGNTGTVYAYNAGVEYAPVDDLRFRGSYSRAVRAPNLSELFSSLSQNFAPGFVDPCGALNIGTGSPTRAANCAADGVPASFDYRYQSSLQTLSGGNPDLSEETSDSYTVGFVAQPRFIPGLAISLDWFDITVNDVITAPTAQQIVNTCYDASDLDNQFCALFERVGAGQTGPAGEEPFRIIEGSLEQTLLNYAKLKQRGINADIAYSRAIGPDSRLGVRLIWTHQIKNETYFDPTDPERANTNIREVGTPKDAVNFDIDLKVGATVVNYQARYLSKQIIAGGLSEDIFTEQGRPPQNADYADILYYPDVLYHDIRVGFQVDPGSNFYLGVDNVTDRLPPLSSTGIGAGTGIFEPRGRYFYAGVTASF